MGKKRRGGFKPQVPTEPKEKEIQYRADGTEDFDTELDQFEKERDKVSLNLQDDGSEEEEEEEEVFRLKAHELDDEEDDEDDEEDYDDEDEEEETKEEIALRKFRMTQPHFRDDDEEFLGEAKNKEISDKAWGKRKTSYYQDEEMEKEDEDALKEEEAEAKRLLKEKYSSMQGEDFGDEEVEESFQTRLKKDKAAAKKEKKAPIKEKTLVEQATLRAEKIEKDLSSMSRDELIELINRDSPEFLELVSELKEQILELKNDLRPILHKVKAGLVPHTKTIGLLEMKYNLMMSYSTNISFYLLLKASGTNVKDHPVINQLIQFRSLLDKLKPIEEKLAPQIRKLLEGGGNNGQEEEEGEEEQPKPKKLEEPRKIKKAKKPSKEKQSQIDTEPEESKEDEEEEQFVRMSAPADKKKKKSKKGIEAESVADFGDATEKTEDFTGVPKKKAPKKQAPVDDSLLDALEDAAADFGDEDLDDSYYQEVKAQKKKEKREKKLREAEEREEAAQAAVPQVEEEEDGEDGDEKRSLTREMMKNRGLTIKRKKELKNPRVKKRMKFEKAQKKLKSMGIRYADKTVPYQGETTGIKTNLSRSVKIK